MEGQQTDQAEHHRRHRGQQVDQGGEGAAQSGRAHLGDEQGDADADRDGDGIAIAEVTSVPYTSGSAP